MATVIVGAGIVGSSTAYYLSQAPSTTSPSSIHIIESSPELFASASGYAGGFLARDWFGSSTASLGALSFDLHKQLAEEHNGAEKWGYYRSITTSLVNTGGKRGDDWLRQGASRVEAAGTHQSVKGKGPVWLRQSAGDTIEVISDGDSTAQVNPLRLSRFLLDTALSRGCHLHQQCSPTSLGLNHDGTLCSLTLASTSTTSPELITIPCSRLIITAGAWTTRVLHTLFPRSTLKLPITSLAGHSLVLRSPRWKVGDELGLQNGGSEATIVKRTTQQGACHAVYTTDASGWSPEIFSRTGGEIYIAGLNDANIPLPELATGRKIDPACIAILKDKARELLGKEIEDVKIARSKHLDKNEEDWDLEILREGLCFRPVGPRGAPFIGKLDDKFLGGAKTIHGGGVWVAAGHGPWGISMSLGTGCVMAEMVEGRAVSADVQSLGVL